MADPSSRGPKALSAHDFVLDNEDEILAIGAADQFPTWKEAAPHLPPDMREAYEAAAAQRRKGCEFCKDPAVSYYFHSDMGNPPIVTFVGFFCRRHGPLAKASQ